MTRVLDPISTVDGFLRQLQQTVGSATHDTMVLYRGHRDSDWKLLPQIARPPFTCPGAFCRTARDNSAERNLFLFFRDYAAALMPAWVSQGNDKEVSWKRLVVAQHHGLPTRLIDWSTNPLVALFFAVEGEPVNCTNGACPTCGGSGTHASAVHAITDREAFTVEGLAAADANGFAPAYAFDDRVGVLRPPDISPRIAAQSSLFTIRKDPGIPIQPDLTAIIPQVHRPTILRQLEDLGINRRTLFPDMDGIAAYIKWACQFWKRTQGVNAQPSISGRLTTS
jgi:hypothetical protein